MSALDSVSPTDAELTLKVFKTLSGDQSTSPRDFMEAEYEKHEREWKRAQDQTKVKRAFHCLHLLGYARESDGHYILIDPKVTADVVMRTLLKSLYDETKKGLNDFHRRELFANVFFGRRSVWERSFLSLRLRGSFQPSSIRAFLQLASYSCSFPQLGCQIGVRSSGIRTDCQMRRELPSA